jgi:hypothetical protein
MNIRALVKGALTFVPGADYFLPKAIASTNPPASYFYGVWLKHLAILNANGIRDFPQTVAELGPGDTLGLGLAAVLSGAKNYYGLDVVAHTDRAANAKILNELIEMFARRAPRPTKGWPNFDKLLDERLFPSAILTDARLNESLKADRLKNIHAALEKGYSDGLTISYRVPWSDANVVATDSVDLVISQAVLEHVMDVRATYRALFQWLKPGAVMSHQIDFRSHELTKKWNGFRAISEPVWKIMMGRRPYLINREPWSVHRQAITDSGFEIIHADLLIRNDGISRSQLAERWKDISDEDLSCAEVLVQARKPQ